MRAIVVSIDFEMRWGVLDRVCNKFDAYRDNLLSVKNNIPWMLKIFEEREICATWATVGALGCDDWEGFNAFKPKMRPSYQNPRMHYDNNFNLSLDPLGEMYFAHDLIKSILRTPGQELGMHTFGHIYGTERNVTYEEFICDIQANINIFQEKFGICPTSLVYPRNQVVYQDALLNENLIQTFRGNEDSSCYSAKSQREKKLLDRGRALLDSINPLVSYSNSFYSSSSVNIQSSAMLRIHMNYLIRKLHLLKLKSNISRLKSNEYYHIWFHPHNIGTSEARKKDFINFFDFIGNLISKGQIQSENMHSMSEYIKKHQAI
jgi:hypothetical protein